MRRAAKVDATQAAIVEALRKAGCYVWIIGLPVDLLVGLRGDTWLLEVKRHAKAPRTALQRRFMAKWGGRKVQVVSTPVEALRAVGL